jgi:hypothetical protein
MRQIMEAGYIVTHTHPDMDAVCSVWLLRRFGDDAGVEFVNTGNPDPALLAEADAVVDTGRVYDPDRLRFDHHQDASLPAACMLVFEYVVKHNPAADMARGIVALCDAGDRWQTEADESRRIGLHAIFSGGAPEGDDARMEWGCRLLDALYTTEQRRKAGQESLAVSLQHSFADGDVVFVVNGGQEATGAAFEEGAQIVLFYDTTNPDTTPVGLMRNRECHVHLGELVECVIETTEDDAVREELQTWFRHLAGFFAGRGTLKAPDPRPVECDLYALCELIAAAYLEANAG